jgi:acetoacetyl-CoA synthetase
VLDRLTQIAPRVLFCVDGYYYKGKFFDVTDKLSTIVDALPTLTHVVQLPNAEASDRPSALPGSTNWQDFLNIPEIPKESFAFEEVDFDHPLWILFSSGTTGLPKAIVHGHGGTVLEQLKLSSLHYDLRPDDRIFFYTTTGWMMWNYVVSSLLVEARPVLYDGNPMWPEADVLWSLADKARVRLFGASPTLQQLQERAGVVPKAKYALERLELIMLAGSPVSAECMNWYYENVKTDLYVAPGSGGTDICSGFCGPMPGLPVKAGVIQMPHLGVDLQVYDENGTSIRNAVGEFVVTQPMPSMPLFIWNDEDAQKYIEAYFDTYPGVWRQGDYLMIDDDEGCYVLGRSDATLNRYGVRIGTAEIYRSLETLDEVEDSLIVNIELPNGGFFMPLFVKLPAGRALTESLEQKICDKLKKDYSPRHVPDRIYQVDDVPYTLTGKKMEVPVRKILLGVDEHKAVNRDAMRNPESLDFFVRFQQEQTEYSLAADA